MGPVRQNPIQRTVRTAHVSVLMTVYNFSTQYSTEQTTIIAQMLSIGGKGGEIMDRLTQLLWHQWTAESYLRQYIWIIPETVRLESRSYVLSQSYPTIHLDNTWEYVSIIPETVRPDHTWDKFPVVNKCWSESYVGVLTGRMQQTRQHVKDVFPQQRTRWWRVHITCIQHHHQCHHCILDLSAIKPLLVSCSVQLYHRLDSSPNLLQKP